MARHLAAHPEVGKISFTGSLPVGRATLEQAVGSIRRVILELGGKSPAVIL